MEVNGISGETPAWKRYYAEHKEEVLAKQREQRRWLTYYERHRDDVKEKARARYYQKQGREVPPVKEHKPKTPKPTPKEVERISELLAELRELVPYAMKPVREKKPPADKKTPAANLTESKE